MGKLNPKYYYNKFKNYFRFFLFLYSDFKKFKDLDKDKRLSLSLYDIKSCFKDKTIDTPFDAHYIYHPAWAARIIRKTNPDIHIDISSGLSFSTMLSAFVPVKFYDFRPAKLNLAGLTSERADLLSLPFPDNSINSLSCMHTIEHIGLGRYGEPIDPDADLKAINELIRVLAPRGSLLFVVPVGKPKIVFNAHRIYSFEQIVEYFDELELKEFSLIPDNAQDAGIIINATGEQADSQNYGCGCFWFTK